MGEIVGKRPEYDMKAIGRKLRELRLKKKLTEQDVGKFLYVSPQAVHKWEHGKCFPAVDNLFALCELYGVNPLEVMVKKSEITQSNTLYVGIKEININMWKRLQVYMGRFVDKLF